MMCAMINGSRSDRIKYYIGVRIDNLDNPWGGRALSEQIFPWVTDIMHLVSQPPK